MSALRLRGCPRARAFSASPILGLHSKFPASAPTTPPTVPLLRGRTWRSYISTGPCRSHKQFLSPPSNYWHRHYATATRAVPSTTTASPAISANRPPIMSSTYGHVSNGNGTAVVVSAPPPSDSLDDIAGQRARVFLDSWLARPSSESHVHVRDPLALARKIASIIRDGPSHLHMIADFDMTMTKYLVNGKRGLSSHGVIKNSPATRPEFREAGQALYDKYYPKEIDPHISRDERYRLMETWWRESHDLIVSEGIRREDLGAMVRATPLTWRSGVRDLVDVAGDLNVYFMVFSAGVKQLIQEILRDAGLLQPHVHVVSNQMLFDDSGLLVGFAEPVIHTLNKSEIVLRADSDAAHRHLEAIRNRNNVVLLGDSLGDAHMADGVPHSVALRVGYCNHDPEIWLDQYAAAFDIVILDDAGFDWVLSLLDLMRMSSAETLRLAKAECTPGEEELQI